MNTDDRRRIELRHATWSLDLAVTTLLGVVVLVPTLMIGVRSSTDPVMVLISCAMVAVMVLRRRHPLSSMFAVVACCLAQLVIVPYPTPSLLVVPLAVYSVARWVPGPAARSAIVFGLAGSVLGPVRWTPQLTGWTVSQIFTRLVPGSGAGMPLAVLMLAVFMCAAVVISSYATGRRVRESAMASQERLVAAARRHQLELSEAEQAARTAEANVRAQIARELHDIVAHSLSVMVVQAEGGRAIAAKRPEQAVVALDTIAETGRDALSQMRRIVGVLRGAPDETADFAPSPGLEQIPELVERAGDGRVRLMVTGRVPAVPPTFALVVYRVVQEAITNFLKHAGPGARAQVQLSYGGEVVVVEVLDDGAGAAAPGDGRGHGLQGMRERVASQGGQLVARPRDGGGFLVRAVLPVPGQGRGAPAPVDDHTRMMGR